MTAQDFASSRGICQRVARRAFARSSCQGETLPLIEQFDHRGGAGGKVWGLAIDAASPTLRLMLGLPATPVQTPVKPRLKARPADYHFRVMSDKQRILEPILCHPRGSSERARAFEVVAGQQHRMGDVWASFSIKTLREWVLGFEKMGASALVPAERSDKGKARVLITRAWDDGCGFSDLVKDRIADQLNQTAHGLVQKGRSDREIVKLCAFDLQRLTTEAGAMVPKADLTRLCKLNSKWASKYKASRVVHQFDRDHKVFSDRHEFRVHRELTRIPMEVLYGDVHALDIWVEEALQSSWAKLRAAAKKATKKGLTSVRVAIIGWLDGSSHYLWATPVLLGPGQGITQQDAARSLYEVFSCPWGGIPKNIVIDNGSEYKAILGAVSRFCAMSELQGFGVVKCRPYSPEGKGALEGAFGILEKCFLSALPGYIAGDRMKSPTKSKGRKIDPYSLGVGKLVQDIALAVAQYNGTTQEGRLAGLSPKAMLEAKIAQNDRRAQVADEQAFDFIFSYEKERDVSKGSVTIGKRAYSGPVLAQLMGEKQVKFLVPMRDPTGTILHLRGDTIHQLTCKTFGQLDRNGAKFQGEMVKQQRADIAVRRAKGDPNVDVQAMLSAASDLTPVTANPPDRWQMSVLDKDGLLTASRSEEEARDADDAVNRADLEEFLALRGERRREASGCNR